MMTEQAEPCPSSPYCEGLESLTAEVVELRRQLIAVESNQLTSNSMLRAICDRFAIDVSIDASRKGVRFRGSPVVAVIAFVSIAITALSWFTWKLTVFLTSLKD